jgi:phosphoribosyl 1,2-cyclic phosphodiesterase
VSRGLRFSVLASGSAGNALYVETEKARVLIDAGLSCRELIRRLEMVGIEPEGLDGVVVTHEHLDHVKGAGPLARKFHLPVYVNRRTYERSQKLLGPIAVPVFVQTGQTLTVKDLQIETFTKCHDAVDPLGIILSCKESKLGLITDLGRSTHLVEDRLKGCGGLIMEFNYDPEMLDEGPYPLYLKRRIRGADGHLSNGQAGDLLSAVHHEELQVVIMAHLSQTNNDPSKAFDQASETLEKRGLSAPRLLVSRQDDPLPLMDL